MPKKKTASWACREGSKIKKKKKKSISAQDGPRVSGVKKLASGGLRLLGRKAMKKKERRSFGGGEKIGRGSRRCLGEHRE